jgi:hypothetical protein
MAGWDEVVDTGKTIKVHNGKILVEIPLKCVCVWDTPANIMSSLFIELGDCYTRTDGDDGDMLELWDGGVELTEEECESYTVRDLDSSDVMDMTGANDEVPKLAARTLTHAELEHRWQEQMGEQGFPFEADDDDGQMDNRPWRPHSADDLIAKYMGHEPEKSAGVKTKPSKRIRINPDDVLSLWQRAQTEQSPNKKEAMLKRVKELHAQLESSYRVNAKSVIKKLVEGQKTFVCIRPGRIETMEGEARSCEVAEGDVFTATEQLALGFVGTLKIQGQWSHQPGLSGKKTNPAPFNGSPKVLLRATHIDGPPSDFWATFTHSDEGAAPERKPLRGLPGANMDKGIPAQGVREDELGDKFLSAVDQARGAEFVIEGPQGYFAREGAGGTPRWVSNPDQAFKGTFQDCQTEVQIRGLAKLGGQIVALDQQRPRRVLGHDDNPHKRRRGNGFGPMGGAR